MIQQAEKDGKSVHFANLMDLCHLKNAELARHLPKYEGRVVLRGDMIKDEQGYSGSIHRARRFIFADGSGEILGHHLKASWYGREASDAVSVYTQVKMTEAPRLYDCREKCPERWTWIPSRQRPKSWDKIEDPAVPLEWILPSTHGLSSFSTRPV